MNVFISHSRQNGGAALKLCDKLSGSGLKVWLDTLELDSGADWNPRVADAIREADAFVFLVGPGATPDRGQQFEWQQVTEHEYYLDPQKPLVPVVIGNAEIPGFLRARQTLQVDESSIDFEALAAKIAQAMQNPDGTVDLEKLERGRVAREQALQGLKEYSLALERDDVKRAALRGLNTVLK